MKKILLIVMAATVAVGFSACGATNSASNSGSNADKAKAESALAELVRRQNDMTARDTNRAPAQGQGRGTK